MIGGLIREVPWSRPHLVDKEGQKSHHNKNKHPKPTSENIVILKQPSPGMMCHVVPKAELKCDCEQMPHNAND